MMGEEQMRHRILWRLWDWREAGGNVSLDAFPSFTYDRRKDDSVQISLLWRLFRYVRTKDAQTSIDLIYLPIWR